MDIFHISRHPLARRPVSAQWAQTYHCGGAAAGLGLGGAGGQTVCAAVGERWGGA